MGGYYGTVHGVGFNGGYLISRGFDIVGIGALSLQ
jgi:hypothetical protein